MIDETIRLDKAGRVLQSVGRMVNNGLRIAGSLCVGCERLPEIGAYSALKRRVMS